MLSSVASSVWSAMTVEQREKMLYHIGMERDTETHWVACAHPNFEQLSIRMKTGIIELVRLARVILTISRDLAKKNS